MAPHLNRFHQDHMGKKHRWPTMLYSLAGINFKNFFVDAGRFFPRPREFSAKLGATMFNVNDGHADSSTKTRY